MPLAILLLAFMLVLGYLVVSPLARRDVRAYAPTPDGRREPPPEGLYLDTVTVDARDETAWRYLDLATGIIGVPPDTTGWDLAFRRFHVITSGAALDLGATGFDDVRLLPDTGYVVTTMADDTVNPALHHWYRYSFVSHLLEPGGRTFGLRTEDNQYAKLEFLSYYCPGTVPGCITLRYAYQGAGGNAFE
jgi:hypothetical protein